MAEQSLKDFYGSLIGASTNWRKIEYNWRDVALYSLGVGADDTKDPAEIDYYYEKDMKAIPTFGTVPYFNAVNNEPQQPTPYPATFMIAHRLNKYFGHVVASLDFDHEIIMHRPIDPIKGTFVFQDTIDSVYDRGDKGMVIKTHQPVYDEAGRLICENNSTATWFEGGNFGGEPYPKSPVVFPDREPDFVYDDYMSPTQAALYRLTGDVMLTHIDREGAMTLSGQERPFMMGFCPMGYACRLAIRAVIPGQPERMKRLALQFRSVSFPDAHVRFQAWRIEEGKLWFRLMNLENGKPILERGQFEWQ